MKKNIALILGVLFSATVSSAAPQCIFGTYVNELMDSPPARFSVKQNVIATFKTSRFKGGDNRLMMVQVSVLKDKKTKREFQINTTFRHADDGDNTIGWIEEVTGAEDADGGVPNEGAVVAEISDSEMTGCTVTQ